jgi:hypothetical protein
VIALVDLLSNARISASAELKSPVVGKTRAEAVRGSHAGNLDITQDPR